jgi:hypothetical protein
MALDPKMGYLRIQLRRPCRGGNNKAAARGNRKEGGDGSGPRCSSVPYYPAILHRRPSWIAIFTVIVFLIPVTIPGVFDELALEVVKLAQWDFF